MGPIFVVMIGAELAGAAAGAAERHSTDAIAPMASAAHGSIRRAIRRAFARCRSSTPQGVGRLIIGLCERPRGPKGSGVWSSCPRCQASADPRLRLRGAGTADGRPGRHFRRRLFDGEAAGIVAGRCLAYDESRCPTDSASPGVTSWRSSRRSPPPRPCLARGGLPSP